MTAEVNASATQNTNTAAAAATVTPTPAEASKAQTTQVDTPPAAKSATTETTPAPVVDAKKAEADKGTTEAKTAEKTETKPAVDEKTVAPEKYDLKLPKDSALSDARLEKISSYAKEKGLSNEQAQTLVERESEAVSEYRASQDELFTKTKDSWLETARNDKEIGGEAFKESAENAKRAVSRFGTEEFKKELNKTGLGNHPELLRIFARVGKAMAEDKFVNAGPQNGESGVRAADILYKNANTNP